MNGAFLSLLRWSLLVSGGIVVAFYCLVVVLARDDKELPPPKRPITPQDWTRL